MGRKAANKTMHVSRRVEFLKWRVVRGDHVIVTVIWHRNDRHMTLGDSRWYAVRSIWRHDAPSDSANRNTYEERILLFLAFDVQDAIEKSEYESKHYDGESIGYHMAYEMDDGPLGSGHELFSLMRDSDLPCEDYLNRFHDTGAERTRTTD
jgi:hypothetical protein